MDQGTSELWVPVAGFPIYEVSDWARVRSLDHYDERGQWRPGKVLKPWMHSTGYLCVTLYRDGKAYKPRVHALVAAAFRGPRPKGHDVRHGPNGPLDNRPSELCYGTRKENMEDMERDGTKRQGDNHHNAKLTVAIVSECRLRRAASETIEALADEFGVSWGAVRSAVSGVTWPDCPVPPVAGRRQGSAHQDAKLNDEIVRLCRTRKAAGKSIRSLAREYDVSYPAMRNAIKGITWQHVK